VKSHDGQYSLKLQIRIVGVALIKPLRSRLKIFLSNWLVRF